MRTRTRFIGLDHCPWMHIAHVPDLHTLCRGGVVQLGGHLETLLPCWPALTFLDVSATDIHDSDFCGLQSLKALQVFNASHATVTATGQSPAGAGLSGVLHQLDHLNDYNFVNDTEH